MRFVPYGPVRLTHPCRKLTTVSAPEKGLAQHLNGVFMLPGATDVWTVGAYSNFGIDPEFDLLQVPQTLVLFTPAG